MPVFYKNLIMVARINTNICTSVGAVVLRYSYHYTIKLALIILTVITFLTVHDQYFVYSTHKAEFEI